MFLPMTDGRAARVVRLLQGLGDRPARRGRYAMIAGLDLDLLLTLPSGSVAGLHAGVPYVGTIADMMYRFYPALPEFSLLERMKRQYRIASAPRIPF